MEKALYAVFLIMACLLFGACGSDEDQTKGEHVWKEQTDTIDKAKAVEGLLIDADQARRENME